MSFPQQIQSYQLIVGCVIGSFLFALLMGILVGFFCGVKYTRRNVNRKQAKESMDVSINATMSTTGPLYEEVELKKLVKMSQNVSYDILKK